MKSASSEPLRQLLHRLPLELPVASPGFALAAVDVGVVSQSQSAVLAP